MKAVVVHALNRFGVEKLEMAARFGATDVVNPSAGDPVAHPVALESRGARYAPPSRPPERKASCAPRAPHASRTAT
jgi:hypothetical protein